MVGTRTTHLKVIFGRILGAGDPRSLREAGCNPDTGTCYPGPGCDDFVAGYLDDFQCLTPDIPCCGTKIHRIFPQAGVDGHGGAFNLAAADRTTGTPPVHGIPLDRSPDTALLKDLYSACLFIHHYEKFLCKERPEPFLCVVGSQGNHFIAEIFVNKIIGNNPIYRDRYQQEIFNKKKG
jgi:hypothetical protein